MEAENLRKLVIDKLTELGFTQGEDGTLTLPDANKERLRQVHDAARRLELRKRQTWIRRALPRLLPYFANGDEVDPERIAPELVEVRTKSQHELFRMARLLWSLPFSPGFGRRLRFLIIDRANERLIGILALQSPPLSFPARDRLFCYPEGRKTELVNQTMDIQTLGAVPPYARLLGGKLVALAAASNEIRAAYRRKYSGRDTLIQERQLPAHLVLLTTTSAFGRSSIYNRLRYRELKIAQSIGYTMGYGSFHLMELYPYFRAFLEAQGVETHGGYGTGPRRKWQTMTRALDRLGLPRKFMQHGVQREAFLFPLIRNLQDYMEGRASEPDYYDLPFADLAAYWRERWLLGRAARVDGWHKHNRESLRKMLLLNEPLTDSDI